MNVLLPSPLSPTTINVNSKPRFIDRRCTWSGSDEKPTSSLIGSKQRVNLKIDDARANPIGLTYIRIRFIFAPSRAYASQCHPRSVYEKISFLFQTHHTRLTPSNPLARDLIRRLLVEKQTTKQQKCRELVRFEISNGEIQHECDTSAWVAD
jgi:hypothetical protein